MHEIFRSLEKSINWTWEPNVELWIQDLEEQLRLTALLREAGPQHETGIKKVDSFGRRGEDTGGESEVAMGQPLCLLQRRNVFPHTDVLFPYPLRRNAIF